MTPASMIYSGFRKKYPEPFLYHTKNGKGEEVTKEVYFADPLQNKFYQPTAEGRCNLCGESLKDGGIPVKKLLGASYMDWAIHKAPEEEYLCTACAFCLGMNPEGRIALFRYPIVAAGEDLHLCNRAEMREFLLHPPDPPFVMILPTSQKKHLFAKAKISYSRERFFCNLEERTIKVSGEIQRLVKTIEALRGLGINKNMILEKVIPTPFFRQFGIEIVEKVLNKMEQMGRNEMFPLAMEVAQKMSEEEARCYMDLILRTN